MDTTYETAFTPATSLEVIASLRSALSPVMRVDNHTIHEPPVDLIEFSGKLSSPSDEAFHHIYKSFVAYGYTPMLTERDGKEIAVAKHGIVEATRSDTRINVILLIATIASSENVLAAADEHRRSVPGGRGGRSCADITARSGEPAPGQRCATGGFPERRTGFQRGGGFDARGDFWHDSHLRDNV